MGKKKVIQKSSSESADNKQAGAKASAGSSKKVENGRFYINASYNNTIISATDTRGNSLGWASAGSLGFSGPKKATPFAAQKIVAALAEKLKRTGLTNVEVVVRGVGAGRDSSIRSIINQGFNVLSITDVTPIPHNGPRPPKVRRV